MKTEKTITVTQPYLPPLEEFVGYLEKIWESKVVTNNGPLHQHLEDSLCKYLNVKHISLFSNGTLALIAALQALRVTGEVITTPYSFVATAHSLLWSGVKPVFVDIDANTFNLDPAKIEAAITPQTTAIMPVHCYGTPCDVDAIRSIADARGLKVIYDAAHAFGVECHCGTILNHGDLSVLSFHATKVFNTFEGGAVICHDIETKHRLDQLKNFGFIDEVTIFERGINAKMSEINAAMGLVQLNHINGLIEKRKNIDSLYRKLLKECKGILIPNNEYGLRKNYSYFPIFVQSDYPLTRDKLHEELQKQDIQARRYFYPLISDFDLYKDINVCKNSATPIANSVASRVLCLPIYPGLSDLEIERIVEAVNILGRR